MTREKNPLALSWAHPEAAKWAPVLPSSSTFRSIFPFLFIFFILSIPTEILLNFWFLCRPLNNLISVVQPFFPFHFYYLFARCVSVHATFPQDFLFLLQTKGTRFIGPVLEILDAGVFLCHDNTSTSSFPDLFFPSSFRKNVGFVKYLFKIFCNLIRGTQAFLGCGLLQKI